jgi:hypothetical protein
MGTAKVKRLPPLGTSSLSSTSEKKNSELKEKIRKGGPPGAFQILKKNTGCFPTRNLFFVFFL